MNWKALLETFDSPLGGKFGVFLKSSIDFPSPRIDPTIQELHDTDHY